MYYYILCSKKSAVKVNGEYMGLAGNNYTIIELDDGLIEFLPLDNAYLSVSVCIKNGKIYETESVKTYRLGLATLIMPVFNKRIVSDYKYIGKSDYEFYHGRVSVNLYAENGIRLTVKCGTKETAYAIPFIPNDVNFERAYGEGKEYLLCFISGRKTLVLGFLIDDDLSLAFCQTADVYRISENSLSITENVNDILMHSITTVWQFGESVKAIKTQSTKRRQIYILNERLIPYAFFEELLTGSCGEEFLSASLRPKARELKEFIGEFTKVLPPPHFRKDDEVTLLYKDKTAFARVNMTNSLIDNVIID